MVQCQNKFIFKERQKGITWIDSFWHTHASEYSKLLRPYF